MRDTGWFEVDEDDKLDDVQKTFLDTLRTRAATWRLDPEDAVFVLPSDPGYGLPSGESAYGRLLIYADEPGTVGIYLDNTHVRADWAHNQLFTLPEVPTSDALDISGGPESLAHRTADWFEEILGRPFVPVNTLPALSTPRREPGPVRILNVGLRAAERETRPPRRGLLRRLFGR